MQNPTVWPRTWGKRGAQYLQTRTLAAYDHDNNFSLSSSSLTTHSPTSVIYP